MQDLNDDYDVYLIIGTETLVTKLVYESSISGSWPASVRFKDDLL
jgi:hypothetical protein